MSSTSFPSQGSGSRETCCVRSPFLPRRPNQNTISRAVAPHHQPRCLAPEVRDETTRTPHYSQLFSVGGQQWGAAPLQKCGKELRPPAPRFRTPLMFCLSGSRIYWLRDRHTRRLLALHRDLESWLHYVRGQPMRTAVLRERHYRGTSLLRHSPPP